MASNMTTIKVQLKGIRPLMFDRYAGDNNTQLPVHEKMYLDAGARLIMPALNILSMLTATNTMSVARQFFGRNGKNIALGINAYTNITPFEIPILDNDGPIIFKGFGETSYMYAGRLSIVKHVARLKGGIPNPKERPLLDLPWHLEFEIDYQDNKLCTLENLRSAVTMGGTLGLGTFRPIFGRYMLTGWSES